MSLIDVSAIEVPPGAIDIIFKSIYLGIQLFNKKANWKQKHCVNKNSNKCTTGKTDISSFRSKRHFVKTKYQFYQFQILWYFIHTMFLHLVIHFVRYKLTSN